MIIKGFTDKDYNDLGNELGMYFLRDGYESNEELRADFQAFKDSGAYKAVMTKLGHPKLDIKPNHWKICKTCKQPFLARDRRGMEVTCYRFPTRKFRFSSRTYTNNNYECFNKYRVGLTMKCRKKKLNQAS